MSPPTASNASGTSVLDRFLALPRAMQWAVLAVIGMGLFLLWDQYLSGLTEDINRRSEGIIAKVSEVQSGRRIADRLNSMKPLVTSIGAVAEPRSETSGASAFTDVVNMLVKKHGVSDHSFSLRARGKLPKNALAGALPPGKRAERMTGDLKFAARPEVVLAALADIESSPDIEQVVSVRLVKDANGRVKAHFVLEAWVIVSDAGGASTGAASL